MEESKEQVDWRLILQQNVPFYLHSMFLKPFSDSNKVNYLNEKKQNVLMVYLTIAPKVNLTVVKIILQAGIDPQYINPQDGMTVLAIALANKTTSEDVIDILLQVGSNPNHLNHEKQNLLELYLFGKNEPNYNILRSLLRAGFDASLLTI